MDHHRGLVVGFCEIREFLVQIISEVVPFSFQRIKFKMLRSLVVARVAGRSRASNKS